MSRLAPVLLAVCLLTPSAHAVRLRLSDKVGQTVRYKFEYRANTNVQIMDQVQPVQSHGTMVYVQKVAGAETGKLTYELSFEDGSMRTSFGGQAFDLPLSFPTVRATMTPTGKVLKTEIIKPAEPVTPTGPGVQGLGGRGMDFNQFFGQMSSLGFPDRDVAVGESWDSGSTMSLPNGDKVKVKSRSTLKRFVTEDGASLAEIETTSSFPLKTRVTMMGITAEVEGDYEVTMTSLFDHHKGILVKADGEARSRQTMSTQDVPGLEGGQAFSMPSASAIRFALEQDKG